MNIKRIILGGFAAGLVMNVLDYVNNELIFGSAWAEAYGKLGLPGDNPGIPVFWSSFDFILGILLAFLYAAMRPRFGAGPRTGVLAGLFVWFLVHLTLASHMVDGVFPVKLLLGTGALELISEVTGGLIAGLLYFEGQKA